MDQPLVTLITYCFNGERFVHRYFDALLSQSYPNVELFFYNNGSVDATGDIAESYRQRLADKGYVVNIEHFKENQVTCSLKQDGLRRASGKYIQGCDSDDVMHPEHLSELVACLESHPEAGLAICSLRTVSEESGKPLGVLRSVPQTRALGAFEDCLMARNTIYTPISYMMRASSLHTLNPKLEVYQTRYGENYQLLLPFLYHNLQVYTDKVLGDYYVRNDSYTAGLTAQRRYHAYKAQEDCIRFTLEQFQPHDMERYLAMASKRLRRERLYSAIELGDDEKVEECYGLLKEAGGVDGRIQVEYWAYKNGFVRLALNAAKKGVHFYRRLRNRHA